MRPPKASGVVFDQVGGDVGFAVADVAAGDDGLPEAVDHLLGGEVAPARADVALVLALVEDDRLATGGAPLGGFVEGVILDAGVGTPGLGVVVDAAGRCGSSGGARRGRLP